MLKKKIAETLHTDSKCALKPQTFLRFLIYGSVFLYDLKNVLAKNRYPQDLHPQNGIQHRTFVIKVRSSLDCQQSSSITKPVYIQAKPQTTNAS
jgi:hypothetical protein